MYVLVRRFIWVAQVQYTSTRLTGVYTYLEILFYSAAAEYQKIAKDKGESERKKRKRELEKGENWTIAIALAVGSIAMAMEPVLQHISIFHLPSTAASAVRCFY